MRLTHTVALALALFAGAATSGPHVERGARIKVRGHFEGQRIHAESVRLKDRADDDAELVGRLQATDQAGRLRLHGVWVAIDEGELKRRARRWVRRLEPGDWVKVEGHWTREGELLADTAGPPARDRRRDALEGVVSATRAGEQGGAVIAIGPFAIETNPQTEWRGFE